MYRQVMIEKTQTSLQRILWRFDSSGKIETYELKTVTYGTASAAFLAIRSLLQLAALEINNFPTGSEITRRDFYVDDLLTGADTYEDAKLIRDEVSELLAKGGFQLRKWASNCKQLLQNFPASSKQLTVLNIDESENIKTLGLQWNANTDRWQYTIAVPSSSTRVTKRNILASISQIFDPLGLVGPVIIKAKILMQRLWQLQLSWDESVPLEINSVWRQYQDELQFLNKLSIPRNANTFGTNIQLHGFSDASENAYGACIYLRSTDEADHTTINLLCSKSKVAPLKNVSLPRLELCGALLLAQLTSHAIEALNFKEAQIHYWSDSTITLAWIRSTSRKFKTFVANRVGEIQQLSNPANWNHVGTADNPADLISRGMNPEHILSCELWWHGPKWLALNKQHWPLQDSTPPSHLPEQRETLTFVATFQRWNIFDRYSTFSKLIRVIAYCIRFFNKIKCRRVAEDLPNGPLTSTELKDSTLRLVRYVQHTSFNADLRDLQSKGCVNERSSLLSLNPFLDHEGTIRVGGRLRKSNLLYTERHPAMLPAYHAFTKLIVRYEHIKHMHAGPQTTLAAVRQQYWPLSGRSAVRQVTRKCLSCYKVNPTNTGYMMGELPKERLLPARPFTNCGVDYGGPIYLRESSRRNSKTYKAYIAVFVCFASKAIHIELVNALSSEAFISALRRFISRRGKVCNIYSDNGTNFVGANKDLQELYKLCRSESHQRRLSESTSIDKINWHFIPPSTPHFGGLWEAGVKSVKQHLQRVIGSTLLTYEEMYTLLTQIEAALNSTPLIPLSTDPNDSSFLTPGHFLIGDSLTALPEPDMSQIKTSSLAAYPTGKAALLEAMVQRVFVSAPTTDQVEAQSSRSAPGGSTSPRARGQSTSELLDYRPHRRGSSRLRWHRSRRHSSHHQRVVQEALCEIVCVTG